MHRGRTLSPVCPGRSALLGLLVVCCTNQAIATRSAGLRPAEPVLVVGCGAAYISNPQPHRFGIVHPRPGFRVGVLILLPESRLAKLELGLLADVRRTVTHDRWWSGSPGGLYAGVGLTRTLHDHKCSLELGLSLGLEGVGRDSWSLRRRSSGIWNERPRLVAISAGIIP
jgi:hypothetical protein